MKLAENISNERLWIKNLTAKTLYIIDFWNFNL